MGHPVVLCIFVSFQSIIIWAFIYFYLKILRIGQTTKVCIILSRCNHWRTPKLVHWHSYFSSCESSSREKFNILLQFLYKFDFNVFEKKFVAFDAFSFRSFPQCAHLFTIIFPLFFINYNNVLSVEHKVIPEFKSEYETFDRKLNLSLSFYQSQTTCKPQKFVNWHQ